MVAQEAATRSLTSRTHAELRLDILRCQLKPGEKLRIGALQERFGASLSVVREALSRLSSEGLVDAIDQRGFRVSQVSLSDLADLARTRRQIEGIALRQAIELGSLYWEAAVSSAYADLVRQDQGSTVGERYAVDANWVAAHENFHRALISGCDSPWLIRLSAQLAERAQRYRYLSVSMVPHRDAPAEHKAIVQAVLARDADRAVSVLHDHFTTTERILTEATGHLDQVSVSPEPGSRPRTLRVDGSDGTTRATPVAGPGRSSKF